MITGKRKHFTGTEEVVFCVLGLFPPTSGTAYINDYDIRTNIDDVRHSLGMCPQYDLLFEELTVEEHLYFFCKVGLKFKIFPIMLYNK